MIPILLRILTFILVIITLFSLFILFFVFLKESFFTNNKFFFQDISFKNLAKSKPILVKEDFNLKEKNQTSFLKKKCQIKLTPEEVVGNSMSGIIENGEKIKVLENYYQCHPIQRNDIIIYQHSKNQRLIKVVKALPKDRWELKEKDNGYQIFVNNQILTNAQKIPYFIPKEKSSILKLYVKNYPVIPENTYLILGNKIEGSLDSTRFGLIDRREIIGKVISPKSF